jgi:hypothetical protein
MLGRDVTTNGMEPSADAGQDNRVQVFVEAGKGVTWAVNGVEVGQRECDGRHLARRPHGAARPVPDHFQGCNSQVVRLVHHVGYLSALPGPKRDHLMDVPVPLVPSLDKN